MTRKRIILVLAIVLSFGLGCAKAPPTIVPSAPPPIGSLNCAVVGQVACTFDVDTNATLAAAHAIVLRVVTDNNAGNFVLTASQKSLLNQIVDDLNLADAIFQAWHNAGGSGSTVPVQSAVAKVQADQNALNAVVGGK